MEFSDIHITREKLVCPPPLFSGDAGAVLDFYGVVREQEGTEMISGIRYEVYEEMALGKLRKLALETAEKHGLKTVVLHHRVGLVPVAEPSLFLRVCAAHRGAAFEAGQEMIVRLKAEVPIWKHPQFTSDHEEPL